MPTSKPLPPTNEFHIQFGYIKAVKITIEEDVMVDLDEEVRVDLADHPLYKALQNYVKANPR